MKRKFSLLLCVCMLITCLAGISFTASAEMQGDGTSGNPFIVTSEEEFKAIQPGTSKQYYKLGNDITLNSYTTKTNFRGSLDGDGHTITINNGTAPLFTYSGSISTAEFKNINLAGTVTLSAMETAVLVGYNQGASIYNCTNNVAITHTAGSYCGSIVGRMLGGKVEKCINYKDITFSAGNCGGIVGYLQSGTVINCGNHGDISSTSNNIGGVVGRSYKGAVISSSYNTGSISGATYVGGILSTAADSTSITNCFNSGAITGSTSGGIVGTNSGTETTISYCYNSYSISAANAIISSIGSAVLTSCYYLSENSASGKSGSLPLTSVQMSDKVNYATNFTGWDFNTVWQFNEDVNNSYKYPQLQGLTFEVPYPEGTENNPIKIASQEDFEAIKADEGLYYIIEDDFTMNAPKAVESFAGVLLGNNKTITITNGTNSLFATSSGTIKDLTTAGNVSLTAAKSAIYVGINDGTIENCKNNAELTTTNTHNAVFAGQNNGKVTKCFNYEDINFGQKYSGAIVGYNVGSVSYCGNEGNITASSIDIGGIVGQQGSSKIEYCYNIGDISGDYNIGGIVGNVNATGSKIINCFNEGDIESTQASKPAGGIAGIISKANVEITNCYNAGTVMSRNANVSVSAAFYYSLADGAGCTLSGCYYLSKDNAGTAITGSSALTSAQMKDTENYATNFAGFDFENVWTFVTVENNSYKYPQLQGITFEIPYVLGEEGNPILINNAADFAALNGSDMYFRINADNIELTGAYAIESFSGHLDGNGKTIIITNGTTPLFKTIESGAKVSDFSVEGDITFSEERFGAVAATNKGTVYGVNNRASITSGKYYSGGIVGQNTGGTIENCVNYSALNFSASNAGGIVAYNNGTVKSCGNEGNISNTAGSGGTGGIVGLSYASVSDCYNIGTISAGDGVGGIVGRLGYNSNKTISNCYNAGNIISSASKQAGGIIGDIQITVPENAEQATIIVTDCFNQGAIMQILSEKSADWAIIGDKAGISVTVNGCFYLADEATEEGDIQGIVKDAFDEKVAAFGVTVPGFDDIDNPALYKAYTDDINVLSVANNFPDKEYIKTWNKPVVLSFANISYGKAGYALKGFGFVISKTDAEPEIGKADCYQKAMEYINPRGNCSIMAYGSYITEGESYYVRPYATYSYLGNETTIYGDAESFAAAISNL